MDIIIFLVPFLATSHFSGSISVGLKILSIIIIIIDKKNCVVTIQMSSIFL